MAKRIVTVISSAFSSELPSLTTSLHLHSFIYAYVSDQFKTSGLIPVQQLVAVAGQNIVLTICLLQGKGT